MSDTESARVPSRPLKSSSEILNELFGSFNTSFDDVNVHSESDSTSSPNKKRKKKNNDKEKASRKKVKKKSRTSPSPAPAEPTPSTKHKSKRKVEAANEAEVRRKKYKSMPKSKEKASFKSTKIKLDVDLEEGEITDKAERREERKRHLRQREKSAEEAELNGRQGSNQPSKRRHSSSKSLSKQKSGSSSNRMRSDDRPAKERDRESSSRWRSRSRSGSPASSVRRSAPSRREYAVNWEKAREPGLYDRSYYSDKVVRRSSDYNYEAEKKYSGSRGGFGFSGSSSRYEDDYYDYRRSNRDRGSYRTSGRSRSRSRKRSRSPSRTRARSTLRRLHPDDIIDKAKLLEIARANAAKLMRSGVLPSDIFSRDQILAIKAGGKSVEELTEYCKKVAKRDANGEMNDNSSDDEDRLIHHPFMVIDRPMPSITMNIRNAIPLPVRSSHELAIENAKLKVQFPVSSGTQHRYKEIEWKPVDKDGEKKTDEKDSKALVPLNGPKVGTVAPMPQEKDEATSVSTSSAPLAITDGSESSSGSGITYEHPTPLSQVDIGSVISKRLRAMRELQENPDSVAAKDKLESATLEMREWAEAKALEPKFLTPAEILTGPQAWARKDQLKTATAVKSGMGMHLLQRMGWKPGEGLGKYNEGDLEPLSLDVKMDKKGLTGAADKKGPSMPTVFDLSGKHPVSSLMELCAKRRWGTPTFELCFEHGPSHKPQFVYKVTVNGVEYQPCVATTNKKEAKSNSAAFCLQSLGLLPTPKLETPKPVAAPSHLLQTVPTTSTVTPSVNSAHVPVPVKKPAELFPKPAIPPPMNVTRPITPSPRLQFPHSNRNMYNSHSSATTASVRPMMNSNYYGPMQPHQAPMQQVHVEEPISQPPIVQVPLPPSASHGYPGLTTF